MKEFFAWFGEKVSDFGRWFLTLLGLTTITRTNQALSELKQVHNDKMAELRVQLQQQIDMTASAQGIVDELRVAYSQLTERHSQLDKKLTETQYKLVKRDRLIEDYEEQIRRYENGPKQQEDYLIAVEKQLNELFKENKDFGFPNALPIPGSISFNSIPVATVDDSSYPDEVVKGRVVLPESVEEIVQKAPDLHTKYETIINALRKYGTLNGIMTKLINAGCVQLTLTYDPDSETTWVYFEVTARGVKRDACFLLDIPETK